MSDWCVQVIDEHKENLEAQLVCWDQVGTGKDEVNAWVTSMLSKLDESTRHFDDAVSIESRLTKFKVCFPSFCFEMLGGRGLGESVYNHVIVCERERETLNLKTLFYKDCSLGSVKNLANN